MPTLSGTTTIGSTSPRICKFNNGTGICSLGYKLNYPGLCFSQSLGKINSTGFLPDYPICLTDYVAVVDATFPQVAVGAPSVSSAYVVSVPSTAVSGESSPIHMFPLSTGQCSTAQVYMEHDAAVNVRVAPILLYTSTPSTAVTFGVSASAQVAQHGKNVIPHLMNRASDYWVVDTYADAKVLKEWPEKVCTIQVLGSTKVGGSSYINSTTSASGVATPYKALSGTFNLPLGQVLLEGEDGANPASICADDLTSPVLGDTVPASGTLLNPLSSYIEFSISDAVGGVDLSSLTVVVSGTDTVQPDPYEVVVGGADQTGGKVLIQGDPSRYVVRYTPALDWGYNETVLVSVSASDLEPEVGGSPWYCSAPGVVNTLFQSYTIKTLNQSDMSCQIVGLPDTTPPGIFYESPEASAVDIVADTAVSLYILDDTFGVELSSVYIVVDSVPVVSAGLVAVSGASISPVSGGYYVYYSPASPFEYGAEIVVQVIAEDSSVASNLLDTSYSFWTVSDTSLVIENFSPAVGVSYLADTAYLSVDVYDNSFGIDDTYFLIDGAVVSGTRTPIGAVGYSLSYHPDNDFATQGGTVVGVYARNGNSTSPVIKSVQYTLYHGFRVIDSNYEAPRGKSSFDIAVRAANTSTFTNRLSSIYKVSVYEQPVADMPVSITAVAPWSDLSASMSIVSPTHSYGETIDVEVYIEDKDGNSFGPYTFYYTIEER